MRFCLSILFGMLTFCGMAQGYEIKVKPSDATPQKVRLAYYYEDKQYLVTDSAPSEKGFYVFRGKELLPPGIYLVILEKSGQMVDILIDNNNQNFVMRFDDKEPQKTMKITGSDVNAEFYNYQRLMTQLITRRNELDTAQKYERDSLKRDRIDVQLSEIDRKYDQAWRDVAQQFPNTILADMLSCLNATTFSGDSMFQFVNFSQTGLLRTPFFYKVIRAHIARHIDDGAHEIMRQTDRLINMTKGNKEIYNYVTWYLLNFYRTFYKLGMNEVFVHIAEKYYLSNPGGYSDELIKMVENQCDIFRSAMVGYDAHGFSARRVGTDDTINIFDFAGSKPIILMFWSNGCGHCDSAENAIKFYYSGLVKNGYQVYTVCNDNFSYEYIKTNSERKNFPWIDLCDTENLSRYREYYYVVSTPIMYVIDDKRRIAAKLVGEDHITNALQQMSD